MNKDLYFSEEQLGRLDRSDLIKVASYYKLRYDKKASKEQLQDLIWDSFNALESIEADAMSAPMSVRIRRIKESNK